MNDERGADHQRCDDQREGQPVGRALHRVSQRLQPLVTKAEPDLPGLDLADDPAQFLRHLMRRLGHFLPELQQAAHHPSRP